MQSSGIYIFLMQHIGIFVDSSSLELLSFNILQRMVMDKKTCYVHLNNGRGERLFHNFIGFLENYSRIKLHTKMDILDFGCGTGAFLYAARQHELSVYGVDCDRAAQEEYNSIDLHNENHTSRWIYYDGEILPFMAQSFDIVYSWYALEHIADVTQALREISRVLKIGGLAVLFTQDVRSAYEGHVKIPWPPYLHPKFFEAYLEEWGWDEVTANIVHNKQILLTLLKNNIFYIHEPRIVAELNYFNMEIIYSQKPDIWPSKIALNISSSEEARMAARYFKKMRAIGKWRQPSHEIAIIAEKK